MSVAGGILMDCEKAGDTAALLVLAADSMARALGGYHRDIEVRPWLDQAEVNIEPMGEEERRPLLQVGGDLGLVELRLKLVGDDAHHDVGPFRGFAAAHDRETGCFRLLGRGSRANGDGDIL